MDSALDFQSIIMRLQEFWARQGCLIWQPYYSQVGAGTMNPATYLRVLGPEPWKVAYVEPSVRPDDGRYGENPNRLQQHYQFQVILKPDPGDPQGLYLKSLEAIGIDPRRHDIRFVEDNWEQPALGAWGLGWEVWLDGQEITQFTYFQQSGGFVVDPVAVEITYGLERIAMPLQRVRNFRELRWNNERTYGDVNLQGEQEHSRYYFDVADVDRMRKLYELYNEEAELALEKGLVLPAHDYILKCSHTFNILDTRGAVGVTERQAVFKRMRETSHRISEAYLNQRQSLGHPWSKETIFPLSSSSNVPGRSEETFKEVLPVSAPFLFEIGTEEIPAAELESALAQLQERIPVWLDELRLTHGEVKLYSTPRRLVVYVADLQGRQPDSETLVKGPPAERAFDAQGKPTPAAIGFAKGKGLDVSALQIHEVGGGKYVAVQVKEIGRSALAILSEALPALIQGLRFTKTMRWNASNVAFSRPIRWLVALFGDVVVPCEYAGMHSGRRTRGLRFYDPEEFVVSDAAEYFKALAGHGIILDAQERRATIAAQVKALILKVGGSPEVDESLLDEVNNLVEAPTALLGSFDQEHLQLPSDVLVSVMKHHQRYFPIRNGENLMPYFVTVRNGDQQFLEVVADGNEQVVRARFADAAFFIRDDMEKKLEDYLPRLSTLTFQAKLGSMLDKTNRIERLLESLLPGMGLDEAQAQTTRRAAHLCKTDLVTKMVVEMTSLQGIMGRYYALKSGETAETAATILEHYFPRFAGDQSPTSKPGLLLGIADRLDSLAGLFAAGMAPTGTKDPFALRRTALGLVQNLIAWNLDFDLRKGLAYAAQNQPLPGSEKGLVECFEFIAGRLRNYLIDQGYRYDIVDSVLTVQKANPAGAARSVKELTAWLQRSDWNIILPAYSRCVRITRDQKQQFMLKESALTEQVEIDLYQALLKAEAACQASSSVDDFLQSFLPLIPAINRFFEVIMVMVEDVDLRNNRLALLQRIAALANKAADLSLLEGF